VSEPPAVQDTVPEDAPVPGHAPVPGDAEAPDNRAGPDKPAVTETRAGPDARSGAAGEPVDESMDEPVDEAAAPDPFATQFSVALVAAVSVDLPNQHPTVVLRESESPRRQLSFSIGLPDAVALSHAMRRIPTPRPLTHELLSGILQGFDVDVVAVRLVGRQGSVYFAELDLQGRTGRSVHSCRPSDALTVALLQPVPVPILIDRRLLDLGGDVAPSAPPAST